MNRLSKLLSAATLCFGLAALCLPETAMAQGPCMKLFETTKIADGVYTFRFGIHRNMFVVTNEGVIATDPISPGAAKIMMGEIRKVTKQPVKYVIYSHEHWDHIAGGRVFKEAGAKFVSHANCAPTFKANPNPAVVAPDEPIPAPAMS